MAHPWVEVPWTLHWENHWHLSTILAVMDCSHVLASCLHSHSITQQIKIFTFRPFWDRSSWNEDIRNELNILKLTDKIKLHRDNWKERVGRRIEYRIPKIILDYKPVGKRSISWPRMQWAQLFNWTSLNGLTCELLLLMMMILNFSYQISCFWFLYRDGILSSDLHNSLCHVLC